MQGDEPPLGQLELEGDGMRQMIDLDVDRAQTTGRGFGRVGAAAVDNGLGEEEGHVDAPPVGPRWCAGW